MTRYYFGPNRKTVKAAELWFANLRLTRPSRVGCGFELAALKVLTKESGLDLSEYELEEWWQIALDHGYVEQHVTTRAGRAEVWYTFAMTKEQAEDVQKEYGETK